VLIVFITTLAAGCLGVLAMCRMDQVAWKFVRLVFILAMALIAPVVVGQVMTGGLGGSPAASVALLTSLLAAVAAFVGLALAPLAPYRSRLVRSLAAAGAAAGVLAAWAWGFDRQLWSTASAAGDGPCIGSVAVLAGQVLMALLLGAVSLSTMLGHAYLTHTSMTIQPLRRLTAIFAAALALRLAWVVLIGGGVAWYRLSHGTLAGGPLQEQWLMLIIRGAVGLLIPAVFAYMVLETVRLRATQSATGILYFTLVLVYIGELTGQFLVRQTGVPF
jgi:hypothetical protein